MPSSQPPFTPIAKALSPRVSLGEEIYDILQERLLSMQIPPGERLAIDVIARELGASQTPIRAALIRLESEGLVQRRHNSGFRAAPFPTAEGFRQMYEFRLMLEPQAAAMAVRVMDQATLEALRAAFAEMEATRPLDPAQAQRAFTRADQEFHRLIYARAGNDLVTTALGRLNQQMQVFRLRFTSDVREDAFAEHASILAAIESGDPVAAEEAMHNHISQGRSRYEPWYRSFT